MTEASVWLGSNLVYNGNFSITTPDTINGWRESNFNPGAYVYFGIQAYYGLPYNRARMTGGTGSNLNQNVNIVSGKRYRLSGIGATYQKRIKIGLGTIGGATNIMSTEELTSSPHHDTNWDKFLGSEFTSMSVEGIITGYSNAYVTLQVEGADNHGAAEFDNISLQQVVYNPQLDIMESSINITSDMIEGSSATIGLTLNNLSYADMPTSWSIDWGDGILENNPTLNFFNEHIYDISGGINQYTATLYGINQAGEFSESIQINVIPEPATLLLFAIGSLAINRKRTNSKNEYKSPHPTRSRSK